MADDKLIVGLSADIKDLKNELNKAQGVLKGFSDKANTTANDSSKSFNAMGGAASKLGGILAGVFATGSIISFGNSVIQTTAEFQKFEAVLSNTLGSSSAAQMAMKQIQDFAATTPFSVNELTNSFVKLANQGFKPTVSEMRSLGDLAASTGKSFDQLAEAILDAQTGEFERLKEFGIIARSEGDKVKFTFKGVTTEVKKTSDAMRGYILSLGQLEGVTGATDKISATLGGKLSNLGDNFEQLKKNIGELNSGALSSMVTLLQKAVGYVSELVGKKVIEQKLAISVLINGEESAQIIKDYNKELEKIGEIKDINKLNEQLKYIETNLKFYQQAMKNETDAHKSDMAFAYFNVFKEARVAAWGQMKMLLADQEKANAKSAELAAELAKKEKFKKTISFQPSIQDQALRADVDISALQDANKEISDFQAQTNMLNGNLKDLAIIGGASFTAIQIPLDQLTEKVNILKNVSSELVLTIGQGLTDAMVQAYNGTAKFGDAFGQMLKQLLARLLAAVAAAAALAAIISIATGGTNLVGGVKLGFKDILGRLSGGLLGAGGNSNRVVSPVGVGAMGQGSVEFNIMGDKLYGVLKNYTSRLDRLQ